MKRILLTLAIAANAFLSNAQVINILDLGAKNDGSQDISTIVNENTEKGTILLPAGAYRVDSPLKLKNPVIGEGYSRHPTKEPASTWLISNIEAEYGSTGVIEYQEVSSINVENLNIMCKSEEDAIRVIPCSQQTMTFIHKVGIFNLSGCGIRVKGKGSRPVFIDNITMFGSGACPMNSIGIILDTPDCRLTNIEIMGTRIGMDIQGCYAYGSNMHLWTGYIGRRDDGTWWKGTRGIVLSGRGAFIGSQIYPDTSYYLFEQKADNLGGFDITEIIYYDDASEKNCEDHGGALFHAEEGATPNLSIHGGFFAVPDTDDNPRWMSKLYTPGEKIDNVMVRTGRSVSGKNIDVLCIGDNLPDYTVEYADKGKCHIADIFNVASQGSVKATLTLDNGASWEISAVKASENDIDIKFRRLNKLCKGYSLSHETGDGLIKFYLQTPDNNPLKARFTTQTMAPYFRPVDYGNLRGHHFEHRYREVK